MDPILGDGCILLPTDRHMPADVKISIVQINEDRKEQDVQIVQQKSTDDHGDQVCFKALFTQQKTDFKIKMTNQSSGRVMFKYGITSGDRCSISSLILEPGENWSHSCLNHIKDDTIQGDGNLQFSSSNQAVEPEQMAVSNYSTKGKFPHNRLLILISKIKFQLWREESCNLVQIFVKSQGAGSPCPLRCPSDFTISQVKALIEAKQGIPPNRQRLIFAGKELEDDQTLSACGIQDKSTIHLLLKLQPYRA